MSLFTTRSTYLPGKTTARRGKSTSFQRSLETSARRRRRGSSRGRPQDGREDDEDARDEGARGLLVEAERARRDVVRDDGHEGEQEALRDDSYATRAPPPRRVSESDAARARVRARRGETTRVGGERETRARARETREACERERREERSRGGERAGYIAVIGTLLSL